MSDSASFFGAGILLPKSIVGGNSPTLVDSPYVSALGSNMYGVGQTSKAKSIASGVCAAGVLTPILNLAGRGAISFLAYESLDTTVRTHRVKITLDGVVIFDGTTANNAKVVRTSTDIIGNVLWGSAATVLPLGINEMPILFNSSFLVEYASSLNETNKVNFGVITYTR